MTAQTLRYDATILKLKEIGLKIGKWKYLPLTARMEHREHSKEDIQAWANRGVVLEMGVHLFDLARFLTGEEIREVYCELDSSLPSGTGRSSVDTPNNPFRLALFPRPLAGQQQSGHKG